jgi:DNA-binding FadR family transcriptional regulator
MAEMHALGDVEGFGAANVDWHRQISQMANNELLYALSDGVALILESRFLVGEFFGRSESRAVAQAAHEAVMAAIAAGDADRAEQAMLDHMGSHEHDWEERLGSSVITIPHQSDICDEIGGLPL